MLQKLLFFLFIIFFGEVLTRISHSLAVRRWPLDCISRYFETFARLHFTRLLPSLSLSMVRFLLTTSSVLFSPFLFADFSQPSSFSHTHRIAYYILLLPVLFFFAAVGCISGLFAFFAILVSLLVETVMMAVHSCVGCVFSSKETGVRWRSFSCRGWMQVGGGLEGVNYSYYY